jgi:predicted secreted protein
MSWGAIAAIYFLFWIAAAFLLLPFGVRTDEEVGAPRIPGQADSAPHKFDLPHHMLRAAVLGAAMFALYYANWHYQWLTIADLDYFN